MEEKATLTGSSPLARGTRRIRPPMHPHLRIIPARAGFTMSWKVSALVIGDHPRSRGVYPWMRTASSRRSGSSPLARGLRVWLAQMGTHSWIIPARAGFTLTGSAGSPRSRDHPRSRGVYVIRNALEKGEQWIIPARAGFTRSSSACRHQRSDHPRSRGVYLLVPSHSLALNGSSPLARGLRNAISIMNPYFRIIPARAGFTTGNFLEVG